jgi:hypothetical protein
VKKGKKDTFGLDFGFLRQGARTPVERGVEKRVSKPKNKAAKG